VPNPSITIRHFSIAIQHKDAEALELFRRSLCVREAALGSGHPECGTSLSNVATQLLRTSSDFQGAERLYMRALTIKQVRLHPECGTSLSNVATQLLRTSSDFQGAERLYMRALTIKQVRFCRCRLPLPAAT
jgi:NADPH-dependent ferric siderophore reductase